MTNKELRAHLLIEAANILEEMDQDTMTESVAKYHFWPSFKKN